MLFFFSSIEISFSSSDITDKHTSCVCFLDTSFLKDLVIPNPLRDFHKIYNELLDKLYDSMYDLVSPDQFKQYVVNQRAHRWKLLSAFDQTEKYHTELVQEGKSGYGINFQKYTQTELTGLTAQDVKRIENTIVELNRHMQKLNSHKLTVTPIELTFLTLTFKSEYRKQMIFHFMTSCSKVFRNGGRN